MADSSKGIKIILLGESGVGKTNLINVATGEEFEQNSMSSSSGAYKEGELILSNKKKYEYNLWDTAGQEAYRSLNKIFIKNAKIVIFVYAIDNAPSFKELNYWIELAKGELGDGFIKGIVANKIDLYEEQQVKEEDAIKFANSLNIKYKTTSALTDPMGFKSFLEELIIDYIKTIDPNFKDDSKSRGNKNDNSFTLGKEGNNQTKKRRCC
jgi:small GTP-binding protein